MKVKAVVQRGINKIECDDAILINDILIDDGEVTSSLNDIKFVCIADGVGGNAGGTQASHFILESIKSTNFKDYLVEDFKEYFVKLNKKLIEYGRVNPEISEMATTFTGLFFTKERCFLAHIGNTRLYQQQGDYIKQLTLDQSKYQWLLNMGYYEKAEICNKNEIIGCFGGGDESYLNTLVIKEIFQSGMPQLILLTTDGLHEYIDIDDLEYTIKNNMDFEYLLVKCRLNKSLDDASIVVVLR